MTWASPTRRSNSVRMPSASSALPLATRARNSDKLRAVLANEVSRRGTNSIHGAAWNYLRNTVLNANGPIPATNDQQSSLIQNQFGADIGGPILRNKLFVFGDYEGFRRIQRSAQQATLPPASWASGQFLDENGSPITITNPYTNAVYKNGIVPIATLQATMLPGTGTPQISPLNTTVLGDLPTAGLTPANLAAGNNFTSFPVGTEDSDKGDARMDYDISSRMTAFVRYSQRRFNALDPSPIPAPIYSTAKGNINQDNKQLAAGYTLQLTNASALDLRSGFTWNAGAQNPTSIGQPNMLVAAGEPNVPADPSYANGLNTVSVTGFTQFGRTNSLPTVVNPFVVDPKVNYSLLHGHHAFKFGYEYLRVSEVVSNFKPVFGADTYGGKFSEGTAKAPNLANGNADPTYALAWDLADFLFGARSKYELSAHHVVEYNQRMHFLYAQDDWRILDKLTLNLGLRYELATPPFETNNQLANFDPLNSPLTGNLVTAHSGSIYSRALTHRNNLNFAPRLGLAYSLDPKTVVRAAYGISYQQFTRAAVVNELAQNAPYNIDNVITQYTPYSKTSPQKVCTFHDRRAAWLLPAHSVGLSERLSFHFELLRSIDDNHLRYPNHAYDLCAELPLDGTKRITRTRHLRSFLCGQPRCPRRNPAGREPGSAQCRRSLSKPASSSAHHQLRRHPGILQRRPFALQRVGSQSREEIRKRHLHC